MQTRLLTLSPCWVGGCHLLPAWPALRTSAWRDDGTKALVGELGVLCRSSGLTLYAFLWFSPLSLPPPPPPRAVQEADSLASVPLGAAHPPAPASAKRTKAAAAAGGQGGASRKEKKGKHKGWLAFTALSLGGPAPTMGLAGVMSSRLGGEGLGERPRGEPRLALMNP